MSRFPQSTHHVPHLSAGIQQAGARTHLITTHVSIGRRDWIECACGFFGEGLECRVADVERDLAADVRRLCDAVEAKVTRLLALADVERSEFENDRRSA